MKKFIIHHDRFNSVVGFMTKDNNKIVFKIKDLGVRRNNAGANCLILGKADVIKRINEILGNTTYTDENSKPILKQGMCVILEMLLRHFNDSNYKGLNKVWFFDVETALTNKILKCKLNSQGVIDC